MTMNRSGRQSWSDGASASVVRSVISAAGERGGLRIRIARV
jgi:hypothetical protein